MEIILLVEGKNFQKLKDALLKDDVASRASIVFKDSKIYGGKEGYYCQINGNEEQIKKSKEIAKDLAKEVSGKEKDEFLKKIKEEEDRANEGLGGIFG